MFNRKSVILFACLMTIPLISVAQQTRQDTAPEISLAVQQTRSLLGQGEFSEAESRARQGLKSSPQHPALNYLLGFSLQAQQKFDQALASYEKAKGTKRLKPNVLYNVASIHSQRKEKEKAFVFLRQAVASGFSNFGQLEGDSNFDNLREDPRFQKLLPEKLDDSELFAEPTRIIHKWVGENPGDQFGWTARKAGDIDGDGVLDLIATAPTFNQGAGKIYVYSGKTGKELFTVTGKTNERLGNSGVGIGDVNSDGTPDFAAGAPGSPAGMQGQSVIGRAYVYSGKDGAVLYRLEGQRTGDQFGYEVSDVGDLTGDQIPEFFVGALRGDRGGDQPLEGCGRAVVFNGKTGQPLFELFGEKKGDSFGNAAAAARVKEGQFLLAIGAPNAGPKNRGRVYIYSVKNGKPTLKFTIKGDKNSVNLGQMFISFPGDLDGDNVPDVYASDFGDNTKVAGGGKIVVHSGQTGTELLAIHGSVAREGLGTSPSDAGDVDGDGIGDLVVGAWQNSKGAPSGGRVYLYSSADGRLLRTWTCRQAGDTLGFDATGIGDVDGDGRVDFLLTSAWSNVLGPKTGRVFIVAGEELSQPSERE